MPEGSDTRAFADAYRLPPAEAVAALARRGTLTQTFDWRDLMRDEHASQFTVSRLARVDLLASIREQVSKVVGGDLSRRDFGTDVRKLLADAGWWGEKTVLDPATGEAVTTTFDPARLRLIFDVNTRMAWSAGTWERVQRNGASHPYARYVTKGDERVRASHAAWADVTLPIGDSFWATHWPPNGWHCRCRAVPVSRAEFDRGVTPSGGAMVKTAPPEQMVEWVNKRTGNVDLVPRGIDPGFDYNPGVASARAGNLDQVVEQKLAAVPAPVAAAARREGLVLPQTTAEFQAAGRRISETLPDGAVNGAQARRALIARLAAEVGISTPARVASMGAGAALVRQASMLFPDAWTAVADELGPLYVKGTSGARGWQYTEDRTLPGRKMRLSAFGVVDVQAGSGYILVRTGSLNCAVHEYAHRLQAALPGLDALFQAVHWERTAGEPLESLKRVTGIGYRSAEVTRKDKYVNPYQGKEYGERGALEVMTMAMEAVLGGGATEAARDFSTLYTQDRAMFDFVVGLLFYWTP